MYFWKKIDIIKIIENSPELIDCNLNTINKKIDFFKDLGFTDKDIIKITSSLKELLLDSIDDIKNKIDYLIDYGYHDKDIINIIRKIPCILENNHLNNLSKLLTYLEDTGFTKNEIINITCNNPFILLYSIDYLNWKIDNLLKFTSLDKIIKMIKDFPTILGYSIKSINNCVRNYMVSIKYKYYC